MEIGGSVDEVVLVLRHLEHAERDVTVGGAGGSMETPADSGDGATPATGTQGAAGSDEPAPGEWTEALACEFLAGLEPVARRMAQHV